MIRITDEHLGIAQKIAHAFSEQHPEAAADIVARLVEPLREDKARLDWLDTHYNFAAQISRNAISTPTLRDAIDAERTSPER